MTDAMDFDADTPGGRLRFAREQAGYASAQTFAAAIGMKPVTYRAYENNQNGYAEKALDFARTLGTTAEWLLRGGPPPERKPVPVLPAIAESNLDWQGAPEPISTRAWPRDVPVLGTATGAALVRQEAEGQIEIEQTILELTETIGTVARPPAFAANRNLYALYIRGYSMEPRYEEGELIYVDPRRPPSIGDHVVVQLRDGNGHDGEDRVVMAVIKRLVRRTASGIELEQYNPRMTFRLPIEAIAHVHRVVPLGEIVGN